VIVPTRKANGKWAIRWREGGHQRQVTVDHKDVADRMATQINVRLQTRGLVELDRGAATLAEFMEVYWRLHAVPNLAASTRASYKNIWGRHLHPRLGARRLRDIKPPIVIRLRADLEHAGVGAPTVRRAMSLLQSILSFAITEDQIDFNPAAAVRKPAETRARDPHIFLPVDVEQLRGQLDRIRDRTLVSVLAYAGPRPEEALRLRVRDVGSEALHFLDTKRHRERWTPLLRHLAHDLREYLLATGRPGPNAPLFPAHDGGHWNLDDWRNWRRRTWGHFEDDPKTGKRVWIGPSPAGTRPRDLRSSYVTLRVYQGVPLTTIAKEVGTSVRMIERHYAGVIANWDGRQVDADEQIAAARAGAAEGLG
jgi:integrase